MIIYCKLRMITNTVIIPLSPFSPVSPFMPFRPSVPLLPFSPIRRWDYVEQTAQCHNNTWLSFIIVHTVNLMLHIYYKLKVPLNPMSPGGPTIPIAWKHEPYSLLHALFYLIFAVQNDIFISVDCFMQYNCQLWTVQLYLLYMV